jgi:hypothetical protein
MRTYRPPALIVLLALFAFRTATAQTTADWCARLDSLHAGAVNWSRDDLYSAAARLLPGGFGGITTTYFFLKQPAYADSARHVARILAACTHDEYPVRFFSLMQTGSVQLGDYDWLELQEWYDVILQRVPWDGVRSGGIDEGSNRLTYSFLTQAALDTFRSRARALGVPAGMLSLSVERGPVWPSPGPSNER